MNEEMQRESCYTYIDNFYTLNWICKVSEFTVAGLWLCKMSVSQNKNNK